MTASFQIVEDNLSHQFADMPDVPSYEETISDVEFYQQNPKVIGRGMRNAMKYHAAIELRSVNQLNPYIAEESTPLKQVWLRAAEPLNDDITINQAVLAYASDFHFLGTALQPHGVAVNNPNLRIATIDHAIWFHKPINMNGWHLYSMESPYSGNARRLVNGKIFNEQGELVASTSQEGLLRLMNGD